MRSLHFLAIIVCLASTGRLHGQADSAIGPDSRVYKTTPAGELKLHVFRPAGDVGRGTPRPAIIFLHGGGWTVGDAEWMFATAQHFAARGMVGVSVQYRLSNEKDVSPVDALQDVRDAVRWLRRNAAGLRIVPDRIAAYGSSAGGQLAAAAALVAPGDSGAPNLLVLSSPAVAAATDNWFRRLVGNRANPAALSPDSLVRANAPPAVVLQGEADVVTPLAGARGFCARMRAVSSTCELVTYPGVGHLFARNLDRRSQEEGPRNSDPRVAADARAAAERFLMVHGYLPSDTMPRVFGSACQGEGCMPEDSALVCSPVKLVAAARQGAAQVGELRRGDTVASRSVLHLRSPGAVVLRRDVAMMDFVEPYPDSLDRSGSFARGDTLFLLYYEGEGRWRTWHRGRAITVSEFWAGPAHATLGGVTDSRDSTRAVAHSHPAIDTWLEITRADGRKGWWLQDSLPSVLSLYSITKWGASCRANNP